MPLQGGFEIDEQIVSGDCVLIQPLYPPSCCYAFFEVWVKHDCLQFSHFGSPAHYTGEVVQLETTGYCIKGA